MRILILTLLLFTFAIVKCDTLTLEAEFSTLLKTIIDLAHIPDQVAKYFKEDFTYIYACVPGITLTENINDFLGYNVKDQLQLSTDIMNYWEQARDTQFRVGGGAHFTKKYVVNVRPVVGMGRIQLDIERLEGGGDGGEFVLASGRRVDCETNFVV